MREHIHVVLGSRSAWRQRGIRREAGIDQDVPAVSGHNEIAAAYHRHGAAGGQWQGCGGELHEIELLGTCWSRCHGDLLVWGFGVTIGVISMLCICAGLMHAVSRLPYSVARG